MNAMGVTTMDVFEMKSGRFTPLTEEQRATLSEPQLAAYVDLESAAIDLTNATAEYESAVPAMRAANDALREAEAAQAKAPRWSRIDEVRRMIAQSRGPEYLEKFPLTVVDPSIGAAVIEGHRVQADCQQRLQQAATRQRECRHRVAMRLQRWQSATMQTISQEQLIRQHLAHENQLRKDRAEGRGPERAQPRLGSKVDEFAYYTRAHGRGTGGGRAFGRGAYGPSMRGRSILPKE
jgi:hypothetical protein